LKLNKKFYLNFSSIPELAKKARNKKENYKNAELNKLIKLSSSKNFIGVEFPYFRFFANSKSINYLKNYLDYNNQSYIIDCEKKISKKELKKLILISNQIGAKFIRIKCSNILSCERYRYKKKWSVKIQSIVKKIKQIKPLLKKYKIKLAIENHQDLDSCDLIDIINIVGKNYVGINFDVGNAFATCEIPIEFLKKTRKYIINIHLKDYIILPTNKGYALHKCPIMDGDSQINKILNLIKKYRLKAPVSMELGAKTPREIKVRSKKFFQNFIKERDNKLKNTNYIMETANNNFKNIDKLKKLISLNEINMLNKSLKNLNQ
jgi:sugar phosphate isomerase/epimerase